MHSIQIVCRKLKNRLEKEAEEKRMIPETLSEEKGRRSIISSCTSYRGKKTRKERRKFS